MTREKAIEQLKPLADYFDVHVPAIGGDAIRLAVSALRFQQVHTKLNRSRWPKCPVCPSDLSVWWYCPFCGRPRIEEAWAELERRINSGTVDRTI